MYLYTNHSIGDIVYFVEDESKVVRAKVESIHVSRAKDGNDEVEYTVRDFNGNLDCVEQEGLFRSADSAFYSLDKPVEEPIEELVQVAEPVLFD